MSWYQKKPVAVQAIQITKENLAALSEFLRERNATYILSYSEIEPIRVDITTLEGVMIGREYDWIICGVKGEVYPCRSDIFEETYEKVERP